MKPHLLSSINPFLAALQRVFRIGLRSGTGATAAAFILASWSATGATGTISVQVDKPGHPVSDTLWGIFFEDINCSADGGIYSELVRNRSFEDAPQPEHWTLQTVGSANATFAVNTNKPMPGLSPGSRNQRSLELSVQQADAWSPVRLVNEGFWGMAVEKGKKYALSFSARSGKGFNGVLLAQLRSPNGLVCASGEVRSIGADWNHYELLLASEATEPAAQLVLTVTSPGTLQLDMVSLFPRDTWKGRGLRPDLMQMLAGLQPAFMRFPGGCWVEGDTMEFAYRWKETIGDISQRRTQYNIWQYHATHGVGFHEYLQMCEDLRAEPLFVINCGMSHRETVPMAGMEPYVQDALDAIEYCNGPATSRWGAVRAANGHPAPFNLKYMEIGNENGGPDYAERWALFHKAIKSRYPEMTLIANQWGGSPTNIVPAVIDEHYYSTPEFFIQQAHRYDSYDRKGPRIYVGEYAVTQGCGQGNLRAAIGESVFMMGMERNSDMVVMASYAPLFANVNYKRWNPDLICYDSSRSYGLPSYYVQQLFSKFAGGVVLPVSVNSPLTETTPLSGGIGVGTWATAAEFKDMKVVSNGRTLYEWNPAQGTAALKPYGGSWSIVDGALRQTSHDQNVRAFLPNQVFSNYTYTLKARKISGDEGFLVAFNVADPEVKSWWNIGGWANDHHALEIGNVVGNEKKGRIETGRWYDLRIDVAGKSVTCYLDGELACEGKIPEVQSLHASATRRGKDEVIVKVANVSEAPIETDLRLEGLKAISGPVDAIVLTSDSGADENSLDHPDKVAPRSFRVAAKGNSLRHSFPGNSFTVFRVKASAQ